MPAGAAGVLLDEYVSGTFRSPAVIASALVAFGLVMHISERFRKHRKMEEMNITDALFIGVAQAMAIVPGVSRSGITISAGLMRGIKREEAARFSFLLSLPVIAGAALFEGRKMINASEDLEILVIGVGFVSSMITGIMAIKLLLLFLKRYSLNIFVLYRFVLAGTILGWLWLGM